ncbi:Bifunctional protein PyrR [compost metagenome]
MDAIQAFGRAERIELLVLVDRRFSRQIPIQPDYIGIQVDSVDSQKVIVNWKELDNQDSIILVTEKK